MHDPLHTERGHHSNKWDNSEKISISHYERVIFQVTLRSTQRNKQKHLKCLGSITNNCTFQAFLYTAVFQQCERIIKYNEYIFALGIYS